MNHIKVPHGYCPVCGHYGDDCTGRVPGPFEAKAQELVDLCGSLDDPELTMACRRLLDVAIENDAATARFEAAGSRVRELLNARLGAKA